MSNIHAKVRLHRETNSFLQFSDEKLFAGRTKCYLIFKRSIDIFFSFLVLLFVFPWLFPVIILLIKFTSKGPAFFTQKRVGYRDNVFVCIKFRTMYVNNFADTRQAEPDDPRITRVGKFLRKSGMDELPQFINILTGDMSIIGPRPFMLNDYNHFVTIIPNYAFRNLVRPG
ncbi:MAG: sugar transferase, partial [Bacteroidota bacterium]